MSQAGANDDLRLRFTLRRAEFVLDVDESIPARGLSAVFGPSGCGKSSLLRCIAGLERHARGDCRLRQEVWQDDTRRIRVPTHRRRVGLVFQRAHLFPHLSVLHNLRFGYPRRAGADTLPISQEAVLHWLDLEPLLQRRVHELSGGEQQRVAIGRALLSQPRLLLLDEPLSGVDVARKQHIMPFLERLHQALDIPVILVTHQLDEIARLADRVLLMKAGQIVQRGPIDRMLTRLSATVAQPFALLNGQISGHEREDCLTSVNTAAGTLWVPGAIGPLGAALRLLVNATDVSLSETAVTQISILNQLPAVVRAVRLRETDQLVTLDAGGAELFSLISHRAARQMRIGAGKRLYVMIKSVSVLTAGEVATAGLR